MRNCLTDEGRPLGTGLQEQVPNHLRRLCPKGKVVNAEGKGLELPGQVTGKKSSFHDLIWPGLAFAIAAPITWLYKTLLRFRTPAGL